MHLSPEHFREYLLELDPQDIVAELDLSSEKLVELLEDYIYDHYARYHDNYSDTTADDPAYVTECGEEAGTDST